MRKKDNTKLSKNVDEKNIYEMAIELYSKHNYNLFQYQGYDNLLLNKGLDSDVDSEVEHAQDKHSQHLKQDFEEFKSSGLNFCPVIG